jgi:hypothetical protein
MTNALATASVRFRANNFPNRFAAWYSMSFTDIQGGRDVACCTTLGGKFQYLALPCGEEALWRDMHAASGWTSAVRVVAVLGCSRLLDRSAVRTIRTTPEGVLDHLGHRAAGPGSLRLHLGEQGIVEPDRRPHAQRHKG